FQAIRPAPPPALPNSAGSSTTAASSNGQVPDVVANADTAKEPSALELSNGATPAFNARFPKELHVRAHSLLEAINRGIGEYNTHRYADAEDDFEDCCDIAPGVARTHVYLAITKMQLNERKQAIDQFSLCYELDPFGTFGRYAKQCLIILAGDSAVRERSPVDSRQLLDNAIDKINRQSSEQVNRTLSDGMSISSMRRRSMYMQPWSPFGRNDRAVGAMRAQVDATMRAAQAQESANNLKHLLATKQMPGDAHLRAWGTTLTTRYYGRETNIIVPTYIPPDYPLELKAIAASLSAPRVSSRKKATGTRKVKP
ncbi:MAG: hypothetical protein ACRD3W_03765, partial [Terriglobales bacterium]